MTLSGKQARQFLLLKHGLIGEHRFAGKLGALDFVRQAGCIQFDPVDACGKNAELTLQSRVKGFTKDTLYELLYSDRALVDYPDKNLSIFPVEDWPYFQRYRSAAIESGAGFKGLDLLEARALEYIEAHGPVSSAELPIEGEIYWHSTIHWSGSWGKSSNAARAVLEQLYSSGKLLIHHKNGARKYYDLTQRYLPPQLIDAPDPLPEDADHQKWRILRRIGAVGLLWNRPSDAWLNITGLKAQERNEAVRQLLEEEKVFQITVEGISTKFLARIEDLALIDTIKQGCELKPRCEAIAALDCMMWDRNIIRTLFNFDYSWEIYTPAVKRKYGFYVLPLIYGDKFIGRVEAVAGKKDSTLTVKNIWYEDGVGKTKRLQSAVHDCMKRLAKFNSCQNLNFDLPRLL